jgi:hypothetical protein
MTADSKLAGSYAELLAATSKLQAPKSSRCIPVNAVYLHSDRHSALYIERCYVGIHEPFKQWQQYGSLISLM